MIYKALDKLIEDYQKYEDNFPQDYYVEFGRFMVETDNEKDIEKILYKLLNFLYSKNQDFKNGGSAIFHLYESYVPKFDGDENGLDKVLHFINSARLTYQYRNPDYVRALGVANEIKDFMIGGGFGNDDILANEKGILYGLELMEKDNLTIIPMGTF